MPWCRSRDSLIILASLPRRPLILGLRNFTYLGVVIWLGVMLYKRIDQVNDQSPDL